MGCACFRAGNKLDERDNGIRYKFINRCSPAAIWGMHFVVERRRTSNRQILLIRYCWMRIDLWVCVWTYNDYHRWCASCISAKVDLWPLLSLWGSVSKKCYRRLDFQFILREKGLVRLPRSWLFKIGESTAWFGRRNFTYLIIFIALYTFIGFQGAKCHNLRFLGLKYTVVYL